MPAADIGKSQLVLIVQNYSRLILILDDIVWKKYHSATEIFQGTICAIICGKENAENSQDVAIL